MKNESIVLVGSGLQNFWNNLFPRFQCDQMLRRKSCPNVSTSCLKYPQQFLHYLIFFKMAQKSTIFLGYFCKQICCQELLKSPNLVTLFPRFPSKISLSMHLVRSTATRIRFQHKAPTNFFLLTIFLKHDNKKKKKKRSVSNVPASVWTVRSKATPLPLARPDLAKFRLFGKILLVWGFVCYLTKF